MKKPLVAAALSLFVFAAMVASASAATTYEVGPGKALAAISDVPWESLKPGDTVLIYYRPEGYQREVLHRRRRHARKPLSPSAASPAPTASCPSSTPATP